MPTNRNFSTLRYELGVGFDPASRKIGFSTEQAILQPQEETQNVEGAFDSQLSFFPNPVSPPDTIIQGRRHRNRRVFSKTVTGRTWYYSEVAERDSQDGWNTGLNLGPNRSALSILPDDDANYPAITRALTFLRDEFVPLALNSQRMRDASPPGSGNQFLPAGSNIPWVADVLLKQEPKLANDWISHIQYTLAGFKSLEVIDREDDRHKYLMLKYDNGLEIPSWKSHRGRLPTEP